MNFPDAQSQLPDGFLTGGGRCAEIIAARDWSTTPIGPREQWPAILRSTLSIILPSPVPIVTLWGPEGVMLYNDAYSVFAGARHPTLLGSNVREGWPEVADFNDNVMKVGLAGGTLRYEDQELTLFRRGSAEQVWMNLDYSPIRDERGETVAVMAIVVETTAKVSAERWLRGERDRLKDMFEQAPGFIAMVSGPEHVFELANPAYLKLVGKRDLIGRTVRNALPEIEGQGFFELLDRAFIDGISTLRLAEPIALNRQPGMPAEKRYVDFSYQPVKGTAGETVGVFIQGTDVTRHAQSEQAVRDSEERFRTLAQALPGHVWSAEPAGRVEWYNERAYQYTGMPPNSLEQNGWAKMVHPDDLPETEELWKYSVSAGLAFEHEMRLRRADGAYYWYLSRALPIRDAAGNITRWLGVNTDIDDQKAAARVLEMLNQDLEHRAAETAADRDRMWRLSSDLMLVADFEATIVSINPAWTHLLGWHSIELLGRSFMELVHPDDIETTRSNVRSLADGARTLRFVNRFRRRDGGYAALSWTAVPDNEFIHAVGRDITADLAAADALRETEMALQQSQKMETIGKLTGGVAHDFNNLLQVISGNLQLLAPDLQGNAAAERRLGHALAGVSRGARLASQLLAFGRRQALEPKTIRLSRLVAEMDDMLRRSLGDAIEVETVVSGGLWNTFVDPAQVENAILNLAINARDAMDGSGKLTIEVGNAYLDDSYAATHSEVVAGQYVMLAVTDTGCGMTPEVLDRAYEPFFSTKPEGKGSGLGLSMVYGFVKQSGGHIKIYSELANGTTIKLYLPRTRDTEDQRIVAEAGSVEGGAETILVAEDDEEVRATVVDMLSALGYRVLKANDAASALAVVESGVHIDLLFSDVVMPGPVKSTELARKATERIPGLAVLFTSGYTENSIVHGGRLDAGVELLSKPYSREALAGKIRRVLEKRKRPAETQLTDEAGTGTPAASPASPVTDSATASEPCLPKGQRTLRILFVEDDDLIRASAGELLQAMGHHVYELASASEALLLMESQDIDVLLTDVSLPGMKGDELARVVRARWPALPIIFATGWETAPDVPGCTTLRKPYDTVSIEAALRSVT